MTNAGAGMQNTAPAGPQMPPWLQDIYSQFGGSGGDYVMTPEDLQMLAQWQMMQQFQLGQGQQELDMGQLGLQNKKLDYDSEYLDYLGSQLGLNREQMAFELEKFHAEQQMLPQEMALKQQQLDNALTMGGYDVEKAKYYLDAAQQSSVQAEMGTQMAKYNWMAQTGQITPYESPMDRAKIYGYQG
jgi:hypothetical protein